MKPLVALLSLSALAASPALAAPRWGDFKDNCVHRGVAPASGRTRPCSGIQGAGREACAQMPGTVKGMQFKHPQVCVNVAPGINPADLVRALVGGVDIHKACEADNIGYDSASLQLSQAGIRGLGEYAHGARVRGVRPVAGGALAWPVVRARGPGAPGDVGVPDDPRRSRSRASARSSKAAAASASGCVLGARPELPAAGLPHGEGGLWQAAAGGTRAWV
ncbi:MAG: hypothetical protein R3F60_20825 [bacterium]